MTKLGRIARAKPAKISLTLFGYPLRVKPPTHPCQEFQMIAKMYPCQYMRILKQFQDSQNQQVQIC